MEKLLTYCEKKYIQKRTLRSAVKVDGHFFWIRRKKRKAVFDPDLPRPKARTPYRLSFQAKTSPWARKKTESCSKSDLENMKLLMKHEKNYLSGGNLRINLYEKTVSVSSEAVIIARSQKIEYLISPTHREKSPIYVWILGKHEEEYILKNSPDIVIHLKGDYTLVVYEKRVGVIRSKTRKRDMKMLDGSLRRADTFLIDWDEELLPKSSFGKVKWT